MTVDKAILRGQLLVNLPVLFIMIGSLVGLYFLSNHNFVHELIFLPGGFILAPLIAWLYWSIAITKWRIWAFTNVEDHHELKFSAVASGLIWKDGSFFERTELRTAKEKKLIYELEQRYKEKKLKQRFKDDPSVAELTEISYSKISLGLSIFLMVFCFAVGMYLIWLEEWILGLIFSAVGLYSCYRDFKKITSRITPIKIGNFGIELYGRTFDWHEITDETASIESFGEHLNSYLIFWAHSELVKININDLDLNLADLRYKLKIYRGRYNNINANN